MGVAQAVEGHVGQPAPRQQGLEGAQDVALDEEPPPVGAEQQVVVLPIGADVQPLLRLLAPVLLQHGHAGGGGGATPLGALGGHVLQPPLNVLLDRHLLGRG